MRLVKAGTAYVTDSMRRTIDKPLDRFEPIERVDDAVEIEGHVLMNDDVAERGFGNAKKLLNSCPSCLTVTPRVADTP